MRLVERNDAECVRAFKAKRIQIRRWRKIVAELRAKDRG